MSGTRHNPISARLIAATSARDPRSRTRSSDRNATRTLDGLLWDGSSVDGIDRGALAVRGFSEGNGYLPGQVIDRSA